MGEYLLRFCFCVIVVDVESRRSRRFSSRRSLKARAWSIVLKSKQRQMFSFWNASAAFQVLYAPCFATI